MKVGDLVKLISWDGVGIIVAEVSGKTSTADNDKFRVVWTDGSVTEKIWDYNLFKVEA